MKILPLILALLSLSLSAQEESNIQKDSLYVINWTTVQEVEVTCDVNKPKWDPVLEKWVYLPWVSAVYCAEEKETHHQSKSIDKKAVDILLPKIKARQGEHLFLMDFYTKDVRIDTLVTGTYGAYPIN